MAQPHGGKRLCSSNRLYTRLRMKCNNSFLVISFLVLFSAFVTACSQEVAAPASYPEQDGVYIITPRAGDVIASPVTVRFGLKGKGVAPAGVVLPNTGHHHLMIDVASLPPLNAPLPADEHHVHFGGGQTQTVVELEPGRHTLQLVLADYLHVPHVPPWISERIVITVK